MRTLTMIAAVGLSVAAVVLTVAAAGCVASGTGQPGGPGPSAARSVAPTGAATDGPPPLPDVTRPAPPPRALTTPVAGGRDRAARWTLVGQADGGRVLLLDVTVGGPPCDAVTAVDVAEGPRSVRITVYAGAASPASCPSGVPAIVGTRTRAGPSRRTGGLPYGARRRRLTVSAIPLARSGTASRRLVQRLPP